MRTRLQRWRWAAVACLVSLLPVANGFTNSAIFYVRDLTVYHWPVHQWLRRTVWSGHLPLWNDEVAYGYGAIGDPSLQLMFLPTLPLRVLLPEALGFNLAVIAFVPVGALGMYLLLDRMVSRQAAALGAIVFATSGSTLSAANTTNISWSTALVPWVVWRVNAVVARGSAPAVGALALAFGVLALAGEPMTLLATATLAIAVAAFGERPDAAGWTGRGRSVALVLVAGALGAAIASFMLLPLAEAVSGSERVARYDSNLWAIAPPAFLETLLPQVYGSSLEPVETILGWFRLFNDRREPLFLSLYLGLPAVLLAVAGAAAATNRRRAVFWGLVVVASVVATLGAHTSIYPFVQEVVPLFALVALDLVVANSPLNPTLGLEAFGQPAWVEALGERPEERLYMSPHPGLFYVPVPVTTLPGLSPMAAAAITSTNYPAEPTLWGIRGSIAPDHARLVSREYNELVNRYNVAAGRTHPVPRARERALLPGPGAPGGRRGPPRPRRGIWIEDEPLRAAQVLAAGRGRPVLRRDAGDRGPDLDALLVATRPVGRGDPRRRAADAGRRPLGAPAGGGPYRGRRAERGDRRGGRARGGGFLVLRDSYDPNWHATVDGQEAPIVRANVIFRAVRLEPGSHSVEFEYRPRLLMIGAAVSLAAFALALGMLVSPRRRQFISDSSESS